MPTWMAPRFAPPVSTNAVVTAQEPAIRALRALRMRTRSSVDVVTDTLLDGLDPTTPAPSAGGVPLAEFAPPPRPAPVWWNAQTVEGSGFSDGGFWVLSRHADVKEVSCA